MAQRGNARGIAIGLRELAFQLARENPTWSYRRIAGELHRLGLTLSPSSVCRIEIAA
jgi:hypothetical protein